MSGNGKHCRRWCPSWMVRLICNVKYMRMIPSDSLPQHRGLRCLAPALDFREAHIITYYYTFIRPRDGGATAQCAWEVASTKLVEGVGNFLGKVDQLAELAEAHLIGAHQLLPSQRLPTDIVYPPG